MTAYAAVLTFPDNSLTYEAYSKLKNESVSLDAAVLVERDVTGALRVTEGVDDRSGVATLGGSLVGMLIGVLGGPVGMLLGMTVGAAGGALVDADRLDDGDDAITEFGRTVPPGRNAIIAETDEDDVAVLDTQVAQFNGTIVRRPLNEVVAELEAQQKAAEEASKAARKAMREQHREERHEKVTERVEALKAKVSKAL